MQRRYTPLAFALAFVIDVRSFGDEVAEYQVAWSMDCTSEECVSDLAV